MEGEGVAPVGINYLVGEKKTNLLDRIRVADSREIRQEMSVIHDKLGCDSVRIAGAKTEKAILAAQVAKEAGLEPWLSPRFNFADFEQTKKLLQDYCKKAAMAGLENEPLIVANELAFDCADATGRLLTGEERHKEIHQLIRSGERPDMTDKVIELMKVARASGWKGTLSYAAFAYEKVDWQKIQTQGLGKIDAGINLYWERDLTTGEAKSADEYENRLKQVISSAGEGTKVHVFEFGSVAHEQGLAWGGGGFELRGKVDLEAQKQALTKYLSVLEKYQVGTFFIYTS